MTPVTWEMTQLDKSIDMAELRFVCGQCRTPSMPWVQLADELRLPCPSCRAVNVIEHTGFSDLARRGWYES